MGRPMNEHTDTDEIVELIEIVRNRIGMDVAVLCKKAGIAKETYYHWLEGLTSPKLCMLEAVLAVMGLKLTLTRIKKDKQ